MKKSDSTTLKDKEVAWNEICSNYNESSLIAQEVRLQLIYLLLLIDLCLNHVLRSLIWFY